MSTRKEKILALADSSINAQTTVAMIFAVCEICDKYYGGVPGSLPPIEDGAELVRRTVAAVRAVLAGEQDPDIRNRLDHMLAVLSASMSADVSGRDSDPVPMHANQSLGPSRKRGRD